jgi:hypothetical protein
LTCNAARGRGELLRVNKKLFKKSFFKLLTIKGPSAILLGMETKKLFQGNKTPQMESFLENMGRELFGRSRQVAADNQLCMSCGADANHFRDELSRKEYGISRLCQTCQDSVFGG